MGLFLINVVRHDETCETWVRMTNAANFIKLTLCLGGGLGDLI